MTQPDRIGFLLLGWPAVFILLAKPIIQIKPHLEFLVLLKQSLQLVFYNLKTIPLAAITEIDHCTFWFKELKNIQAYHLCCIFMTIKVRCHTIEVLLTFSTSPQHLNFREGENPLTMLNKYFRLPTTFSKT